MTGLALLRLAVEAELKPAELRAYLRSEIERRRERLPVVKALREEGHSTRAIAGALGVSQSTVRDDVREQVSTPTQVTGLDGKSYPATRQEGCS